MSQNMRNYNDLKLVLNLTYQTKIVSLDVENCLGWHGIDRIKSLSQLQWRLSFAAFRETQPPLKGSLDFRMLFSCSVQDIFTNDFQNIPPWYIPNRYAMTIPIGYSTENFREIAKKIYTCLNFESNQDDGIMTYLPGSASNAAFPSRTQGALIYHVNAQVRAAVMFITGSIGGEITR
jgi:hypothetical protein